MSLRYARKDKNQILLGVWFAIEPESWFHKRLHLTEEEQKDSLTVHPARRLDWFSTRYLLHTLTGAFDRIPCLKDTFGKPYLTNSKERISISHSGGIAAIALSPLATGIDIQRWDDRIERLAPRFCHPGELAFIEPEHLQAYVHVLWGAKEALYKAHGKRRLDFREHLICHRFIYQPNGGTFEAVIYEPEKPEWTFRGFYRPFKEGMLVWVLENSA